GAFAMPGENPFEAVILQARDRPDLFGPGIPANISRGGEAAPVAAPPEMVAGEEEFAVQQGAVPAGVPRSGNSDEFGRQFHRLEAVHDPFGFRLGGEFEPMDD